MNKVIVKESKCPICGYKIPGGCQCRYAGSAHPDRHKKRTVVQDHLYMLTHEQLEHLIQLQKYWQTDYSDPEMKEILRRLMNQGGFRFGN